MNFLFLSMWIIKNEENNCRKKDREAPILGGKILNVSFPSLWMIKTKKKNYVKKDG